MFCTAKCKQLGVNAYDRGCWVWGDRKRDLEANIREDRKIVIVTSLGDNISHLTGPRSEEGTCKLDLQGGGLNRQKVNRDEPSQVLLVPHLEDKPSDG